MKEKLHFNTATIHGGQSPDKAYGAVMPQFTKPQPTLKKAQESTKVLNIVELITLLEKH